MGGYLLSGHLFIPLLEASLLSGIAEHQLLSGIGKDVLFFLGACITTAAVTIFFHTASRNHLKAPVQGERNLFMIWLLYTVCSTAIFTITGWLWTSISGATPLTWKALGLLFSMNALIAFVFLFFWNKKKEAQVPAGKKEEKVGDTDGSARLLSGMDPHFLFNSLNTLGYLIHDDAGTAHAFNARLAQVYKYFMLNRNRDLVPLEAEMAFLQDYFYLLRVRHDDNLHLEVDLCEENTCFIMPFSLQQLVDNAIRHNSFSATAPLTISISSDRHVLHVSNNVKPKPYLPTLSQHGLRHLCVQYEKKFGKKIQIINKGTQFLVKIPVLAKKETYAARNYH